MDYKETKSQVFEKRESKSLASKINLDYDNSLSHNLKVSNSLCYVCAETNPQYSDYLYDGRLVNYCGECFTIVREFKEIQN